ncbi:pentatricopeptide repeat-containing protein At5g66520-like [Cicer arietinum]|uniref:pentatricopeptide repeat-containing protein At5g66520-like n=1 Tax=Cicer arietinum TaxID=3827 RepID=UPI003CC54CC2
MNIHHACFAELRFETLLAPKQERLFYSTLHPISTPSQLQDLCNIGGLDDQHFWSCCIPASRKRVIQEHVFSLLQSCNSKTNLVQIHSQVVLNGLSHKNNIITKLLSFYAAFGKLQHAHKLLIKIDNPSTAVWNHMIRGYTRSRTPWKSVQYYNQMVSTESEPDEFTYSFLLSACAQGGLVREGEQVHATVLAKGYCSDVFVNTNLINFYSNGGGVEQARHVFDDMTQRSVVSWNSILAGYVRCGDFDAAGKVFEEMPYRNVVSWTTMIVGCAHNGKSEQALLLFGQMRRARVEFDHVALVAALSACAELGDLKLGRWVHCLSSVYQDVSENNCVLDYHHHGFCKTRSWEGSS